MTNEDNIRFVGHPILLRYTRTTTTGSLTSAVTLFGTMTSTVKPEFQNTSLVRPLPVV